VQATNGFTARVPGYTNLDLTLAYERRVGAGRLKHSLYTKGLFSGDALTPE
jgi:hypothetical protein